MRVNGGGSPSCARSLEECAPWEELVSSENSYTCPCHGSADAFADRADRTADVPTDTRPRHGATDAFANNTTNTTANYIANYISNTFEYTCWR